MHVAPSFGVDAAGVVHFRARPPEPAKPSRRLPPASGLNPC
jgi:hypothetical protein